MRSAVRLPCGGTSYELHNARVPAKMWRHVKQQGEVHGLPADLIDATLAIYERIRTIRSVYIVILVPCCVDNDAEKRYRSMCMYMPDYMLDCTRILGRYSYSTTIITSLNTYYVYITSNSQTPLWILHGLSLEAHWRALYIHTKVDTHTQSC